MAVTATGFFDGVHLGHRRVLSTLHDLAGRRAEEAVVVTFWPHPRVVLGKEADSLRLLSSSDEKAELLGEGVHTIPFTREFASFSARDYIEMLVRDFGTTCIVLGHDNRFGSDGLSTEEIAALAGRMGLDAVIVEPYVIEGAAVSSTSIRRALASGAVATASVMLGRPYELRGTVVGGLHLGRMIGFPTANLELFEPLKMLPAPGAYFCTADVDGESHYAMTNVSPAGKVETHILDFDADIYGRELRTRFLRRMRGELSFASLEELKVQLARDLESCRILIK